MKTDFIRYYFILKSYLIETLLKISFICIIKMSTRFIFYAILFLIPDVLQFYHRI